MILVFSGTGNSRYIADLLAKELNDKLISINDLIKNNVKTDIDCNNDNLLIITPTYAWRMPKLVYEYLTMIKINKARNVYFIMSCGGEIGNAAKTNKLLADHLKLNYKGTVGIKMPDNYIIMFKPLADDKCVELIKKAKEKINGIVEIIKNNKDFSKPRNNLYDRLMSRFVNPQFYKYKLSSNGFNSNDNCIECAKCVEVCPLNNIKLINKNPVWGENCTHCMRCISYCPKNAINYKDKTNGKKPYRIENYLSKL